MNYEGSCDVEDWSNDPENPALHHTNKMQFKMYSYRKLLFFWYNNISQFDRFYCIFD